MGGGRDYFLPKGTGGGKRTDGKDVIGAFAAKGYQVVDDPATLRVAKGPRLLALFADDDMDLEIDRDPKQEPSTAEMAGGRAARALGRTTRTVSCCSSKTKTSTRPDTATMPRR